MSKTIFTRVLLAIAVATAAPALAITKNWVRDFAHPYVGLAVFYDANDEFLWRCSGSLISATKFVTAGHCADTEGGAVSARVYFQQDAGAHYDPSTQLDPVTGYPETCAGGTLGTVCATSHVIYNFDYANGGFPDTHDVGVLILDQPITLAKYGQLPSASVLDSLATARGTQGTEFTVSGYGLSFSSQEHSAIPNISLRERLMASEVLVNVRSALTDGFNLQTQGNGSGRGGTCSGDSGGPVFLGDESSDTIVAVTSFGLNTICRGTDFAYRIDQQAVLDWINGL